MLSETHALCELCIVLCWQDVHHGNGTQHILEDDPTIMYMSLHRYDGCAPTAL
jgi:acetoin utilization deacetylase AcuC-like enzyme